MIPKFRAYINDDVKGLFEVNWIEFDHADDAVIRVDNPNVDMCSIERYVEQDDVKLMQFTGLKDNNGVEIYEGDILSLIVYEANREYKGEVVFSKGSFCVVIQIKGHDCKVPLHETTEAYNLVEVLGNIHENPELLEVAE